jgi:hypothetical protein
MTKPRKPGPAALDGVDVSFREFQGFEPRPSVGWCNGESGHCVGQRGAHDGGD